MHSRGDEAVRRSPRSLLRLSLRMLMVWSVLAVVILVCGRALVTALLPLFSVFIDLAQADYTPSLDVGTDGHGWAVRMHPLIARPIAVGPHAIIQPGTQLDWFSTSVDHTLVPIVLFLTALLSWPAARVREWGVRLLVGVPALIAVLLLCAPILLMARVQMWLVTLSVHNGAPFHEPALVTFMIYMESGGRWLLPLVAALVCIMLGRRWSGLSSSTSGSLTPPSSTPPSSTSASPPPVTMPSGPPVFPPVSGSF